MAKINSKRDYPLKSSIVNDDYVVGTDSESSKGDTVSFSMEDIKSFAGGGGGGSPLYDGEDTTANIIAMNPTTVIGQVWWSTDEKCEYHAVSSPIYGDIWQQVCLIYDVSTDTFKVSSSQDGQTQNLGQEIFFNAINDDTAATDLEPKVFLAGGVFTTDPNFVIVLKAGSADLSPNSVYGLNTTNADNLGFTKILTYGTISGIDTSAWPENSILYVSAVSGELTVSRPQVDIYPIATVLRSDVTDGKLFINSISAQREDNDVVALAVRTSWFTGDTIVLAAGTFYLSNVGNKGTVSTVNQVIVLNDNTKGFLPQDVISVPFDVDTLIASRELTAFIEFTQSINQSNEKVYIEVYTTDNDGNVIDSGSGLAVGDLGQPPAAYLESALLNSPSNTALVIELTGFIPVELSYLAGQRVRYHVGFEKAGSAGGNKTFTAFYGIDHSSGIQVDFPINAEDVIYNNTTSTLAAINVQAAIDELDLIKTTFADIAGKVDKPTGSGTAIYDIDADAWVNSELISTNPLWTYDDNTVAADPGAGIIRSNNNDISLVTEIYISGTSLQGIDYSPLIGLLTNGSIIEFKQWGNIANGGVFVVTGLTNNGGWYTINTTLLIIGSDVINASSIDFNIIKIEQSKISTYIEDNTETINGTSIPVNKLVLPIPNLPEGNYRLEWTAELGCTKKDREVLVDFLQDATIIDSVLTTVAKDDTYMSIGAFKRIVWAGGPTIFKIEFSYQGGGGEDALIKNTRFEIVEI